MSTYDDDDIEFDFFDEPETAEAQQRPRRLGRDRSGGPRGPSGPRRPPMRAPAGLVPLARLIGLIAIAIVVVVAFVFWVGACQGKSKHDEYASYVSKVGTLARSSSKLGVEFANKLGSAGLKESDLETTLQQYAQQEQQAFDQAQQIRPPGPLRTIHQHLVDALELRAKGLAGLGDSLAQGSSSKTATSTTIANDLAAQAQLLIASDVVWDQLYRDPATQEMKTQSVTGVVVPESHFVTNTELVSERSFGVLLDRLNASGSSGSSAGSSGGTVTGNHGDQLLSVQVSPQASTLSTSSATTVKTSADLKFIATVQDSGDFPEYNVVVTLSLDVGGTPITKKQTILVVQPGANATATFSDFQLPTSAYAKQVNMTVTVRKVPGEHVLTNNTATYPVFFTLSP